MSIINNMHKDLDGSNQVQPVLSGLAQPNTKKKILLMLAITVSIACAIALIVMIFLTDKPSEAPHTEKASIITESSIVPNSVEKTTDSKPVTMSNSNQSSEVIVNNDVMYELELYNAVSEYPITADDNVESGDKMISPTVKNGPKTSQAVINPTIETKPKAVTSTKVAPTSPPKIVASAKSITAPKAKPQKTKPKKESKPQAEVVPQKTLESGHLNIESAELTNLQIANIYLKEANKAQQKGDNDLAAEKWQKALNVKPDLNEVRKSLAMYHYSQNDADKTSRLLKKGALISPDYSDFNLMLSRIALKNNEEQKAFLYLEQNPPEVEGNLDYYISHAILAQKFKMFERSEALYRSLLTQRPNNGRWLMSLAISQDRQGKEEAAIISYKDALDKVDLSIKAKDYINKRLAYLSKD